MTLIPPLSPPELSLIKALHNTIPFNGWHKNTLTSLAIPEITLICPNGNPDALALLARHHDTAMETSQHNLPWNTMGISLRIQKLIEARFLSLHKETERQSLSYLSHPLRSPILFNIASKTVDRLWNITENTPSKPLQSSASSKRNSTLAILSATTLFWLQDDSTNSQHTFDFLERRLSQHALFSQSLKKILNPFSS